MWNFHSIIKNTAFASVIVVLVACSASKFVPDKEYLLEKVEVKTNAKDIDANALRQYVRQHSNSKWFSLFKIPLGTYAMAGRDTSKWINRTLQRFGEKPIIYDTLQARLSCNDLRTALQNMGYMNAIVNLQTKVHRKKIKVIYTLVPGEPFFIRNLKYDIQDKNIAKILMTDDSTKWGLHSGMKFDVSTLDKERNRIAKILTDNGYYHFHKDFIVYSADSIGNNRYVDLVLHLMKYRQNNNAPETDHPQYKIRNVNFYNADSTDIHLRKRVLEDNTLIEKGRLYSSDDLQKTYNNFGCLQAVRYTNIKFKEVPDSTILDCDVQINTNKPSTISFQPEGTNTAGDLGAAASLTYENRNLFRGSELLSVELRGAFEAIKGLEGYQNSNFVEYSLETKLQFPRFVLPFMLPNSRNGINVSSEISLSYDMQNRPEFHRRVFSAGLRYKWNNPESHSQYKIDILDLNYIHMPWISETFKKEYLDSVSNRNAILRYNYEDLFIAKIGFGYAYNNGKHAFKANIETAGNLFNAFSHLTNAKKDDKGNYTLFNIAYAQYVKADFDYTKLITFDRRNSLALHCNLGIAYPYGNSTVLPFEKRYFSGGANSVRGWSVRGLGPGKYRGVDGAIDFINQTGDMKLDMNMEYRTFLFWKFNGAVFVDAGNIWTLRDYAEQPGGQFKINEFYKQIAVAYGLGLRLNFDYFILRFDVGMKAINPAYDTQKEHYAIANPKLSRDLAFHFAVGLPF
nr:BamA/TamA family outer membrane protein [Xylanibacter oryzae]